MVSVTKFTVQIEKNKLNFFCKMHDTRHDLHLSTLIIAVQNLKIVFHKSNPACDLNGLALKNLESRSKNLRCSFLEIYWEDNKNIFYDFHPNSMALCVCDMM